MRLPGREVKSSGCSHVIADHKNGTDSLGDAIRQSEGTSSDGAPAFEDACTLWVWLLKRGKIEFTRTELAKDVPHGLRETVKRIGVTENG